MVSKTPTTTISDALSHYRSVVALQHKFWAYFQVLAPASVAVVWSEKGSDHAVRLLVALGFGLFAGFNGYLVVEAQASTSLPRRTILSHAHTSNRSRALSAIVRTLRPFEPRTVAYGHALFTLATISAILLRDWQFPMEMPMWDAFALMAPAAIAICGRKVVR